jgi:hypothetical protein
MEVLWTCSASSSTRCCPGALARGRTDEGGMDAHDSVGRMIADSLATHLNDSV